jgi:general secretion pathway protein H
VSDSLQGIFMRDVIRLRTMRRASFPAARQGRSAGFTLLELIMVIVVIGITIAISFPALTRGTQALHLRAAGRDVLNVLRYAREKAITEQREIRFVAKEQGREVILTDALGEGGSSHALPRDVVVERVFAGSQEIREGPLVIRFLPNGSSTPATIVLKSDAGGYLRIITDPITGGARIVPGPEGMHS